MSDQVKEVYEIRDFKPEDKSFIMATFLKGLYYGDSWFSLIPKRIFMDNYKHAAEALVNKSTVKVACLKIDPDVIIGYSILSNDFTTIHWCFVKKAWRKQGVGRSLVPQFPTEVTHLTEVGKRILPQFKNCVFNPFKV